MSLDVYLNGPEYETDCECRECWQTHKRKKSDTYYHRNITHNLNTMANEAGIYKHLWRPDEIGIVNASQLIEPLSAGLALLESGRGRFEKFNPDNGWGDYEGLVDFVKSYLAACKEYPDAFVKVSR